MKRIRRLVALLLGATSVSLGACGDGGPSATQQALDALLAGGPATYEYVIPDGTAAQAASLNTHDPIFPDALVAEVGQSIRIVNEDVSGHTIGPFTVGAGQTLNQVFTTAGVYSGICSTHEGATFTLTVSA